MRSAHSTALCEIAVLHVLCVAPWCSARSAALRGAPRRSAALRGAPRAPRRSAALRRILLVCIQMHCGHHDGQRGPVCQDETSDEHDPV
eukprot:gene17622-biopygen4705